MIWPWVAAVHSCSSSHTQPPSLKLAEPHASGRCEMYIIGLCQAMHSSSPHGRKLALLEVWMPGVPLDSSQSSTCAQILVTPPLRFATATWPDRLTDVRDGSPS